MNLPDALKEIERYRNLALEMEFRLKQAERRNIEHEDDYMAVWKAIKEPNETLLESCKRVVRQRDNLLYEKELNRPGMDEARAMIDTGRWMGMTVIAAVVAELKEARATNKEENTEIRRGSPPTASTVLDKI
jgi:hypothetical protein